MATEAIKREIVQKLAQGRFSSLGIGFDPAYEQMPGLIQEIAGDYLTELKIIDEAKEMLNKTEHLFFN